MTRRGRVEVEHSGAWHVGYQRSWRLYDDTLVPREQQPHRFDGAP